MSEPGVPPTAKLIGVAIVERDGRFLVGVRSAGVPLAGYAEFPGGKCEPGETPEACAVRECREETGLEVEPVRRLDRRTWEYPHGSVDLAFVLCRTTGGGEPRPPFRWAAYDELSALRFPEANAAVLRLLGQGPGR